MQYKRKGLLLKKKEKKKEERRERRGEKREMREKRRKLSREGFKVGQNILAFKSLCHLKKE